MIGQFVAGAAETRGDRAARAPTPATWIILLLVTGSFMSSYTIKLHNRPKLQRQV
jgi:hypothetical protein